MPRRKIQFTKGSYYHIFNRGADRGTVFRQEGNYHLALRLMKQYSQSLQITVIAYCLLPNHYHWLVRQDDVAPAGLLAQRVFNAYVKAYNNSYNRSGTLFESRYKAIHVESNEYLRHLCCYIHANPVRHGIAHSPELWPYSNYLDWIGKRSGSLLDREFINAQFRSVNEYQAQLDSYLTGRVQLPRGLEEHLDGL